MRRSSLPRLVKPVWFPFAGEMWPLLITYGVLLKCENESGVDMLGSTEGIVDPSAHTLLVMLWACLRRAGARISLRDVGSILGPRDPFRVLSALQRAYVASLPPLEERPKPNKERPPMDWPEMRAFAKQELRLPFRELLGMTPLEFHAMRSAYVEKSRREELYFSRLTANVINFSARGVKKWLSDDHFMAEPLQKKDPTALLGDEINAKFEAFEALAAHHSEGRRFAS